MGMGFFYQYMLATIKKIGLQHMGRGFVEVKGSVVRTTVGGKRKAGIKISVYVFNKHFLDHTVS